MLLDKPVLSVVVVVLSLLGAHVARAGDDTIFDRRVVIGADVPAPGLPEGGVAGQINATGFKKIPGDDALNQWSFDLQSGAFETSASSTNTSEWKNLYLAFAVDVRYMRDCFGSKSTVLCTFLHSGVQLSGNLTWSDVRSTDRLAVVVIPIEYVTGTFGKAGPELETTSGAFYASLGARAEYVRDLGLEIQHRILGTISAGVSYSSPSMGLGPDLGFHWIGAVRLFGGGSANQMSATAFNGAIAGGIETKIGMALDLAQGSVSFTNTTRLEGDIGLGSAGFRASYLTDKLELKYLRSVCRSEQNGGCSAPRAFSYGGGIRYEYSTSSYEVSPDNLTFSLDRSVHRLIFFAELARW